MTTANNNEIANAIALNLLESAGGSSRAIGTVNYSGLRCGAPSYWPSYISNKSQKHVPAKCIVPAAANDGDGKTLWFTLEFAGERADSAAKYLYEGKEVAIVGELNSYLGRRKLKDGSYATDSDGSTLMIDRFSIRVRRFTLGTDSTGHINRQILNKVRPVHWNTKGHPDVATWKEKLRALAEMQFTPGVDTFGYAKVYPVDGVIVDHEGRPLQTATAAGTSAAVPNVDGITLQALRDKNWTDEQIKADPKFRALLPTEVPEPPSAPSVPEPPAAPDAPVTGQGAGSHFNNAGTQPQQQASTNVNPDPLAGM